MFNMTATSKTTSNGGGIQDKALIIKSMSKKSAQFIAAGQKIDTIETIVRELIENSIDAEAKTIEVKLTKFGADTIEVEDDGYGIDESDFHKIALQYHTSKITDLESLQKSLETYGFRGEALNCLSTVGNLTIITRTASAPTGTRLIFKENGVLVKNEKTARCRGTTVIVKNVFKDFRVRRLEVENTAKRRYDNVVRCIYEHKLAHPHVRFSLTKKAAFKKEKDFALGNLTLEGSIIEIYNEKVLHSLMPFKQDGLDDVLSLSRDSFKKDSKDDAHHSSDEDDVSNDNHTSRSSSAKRLKIDDNGSFARPQANHSSFVKAAELIDSSFEPTQEPNRDFYIASRNSKYRRPKPTYTIHGYISKIGEGGSSADCQYIFVNKKPVDIPEVSKIINEVYKSYSAQTPFFCLYIHVETWATDFNVPRKREVMLQDKYKLCDIVRESLEKMFSSSGPSMKKNCASIHIPIVMKKLNKSDSIPMKTLDDPNASKEREETNKQKYIQIDTIMPNETQTGNSVVAASEVNNPPNRHTRTGFDEPSIISNEIDNLAVMRNDTETANSLLIQSEMGACTSLSKEAGTDKISITKELSSSRSKQNETLPSDLIVVSKDTSGSVSYKPIEKESQLHDLAKALIRDRQQRQVENDGTKFNYAIHPKFNPLSEQELRLQLDKESFKRMSVIGQFNNGFIITKLNKHLFVIDQHASDERKNYEDQIRESPVVKQPMVYPKPLYLTRIQENTIIENEDLFASKGFGFLIDKEKMPGYRVMLNCTSICKGFGIEEHLNKEDIEEMIKVVTESPNQAQDHVLKKVHGLSATRACRKSVMIGDKLSFHQMEEIVSNMSKLKNPWACAHGRPTIRHLMDSDWMTN